MQGLAGSKVFSYQCMNGYIQPGIVTTAFCVLAVPKRDRALQSALVSYWTVLEQLGTGQALSLMTRWFLPIILSSFAKKCLKMLCTRN